MAYDDEIGCRTELWIIRKGSWWKTHTHTHTHTRTDHHPSQLNNITPFTPIKNISKNALFAKNHIRSNKKTTSQLNLKKSTYPNSIRTPPFPSPYQQQSHHNKHMGLLKGPPPLKDSLPLEPLKSPLFGHPPPDLRNFQALNRWQSSPPRNTGFVLAVVSIG